MRFKLGAQIVITLGFLLSIGASSALADELRIGVLTPITGKNAAIGKKFKKGILKAKEEHPDFFPNAKFYFQDSRSDKNAAVSGLRRLIDSSRVDVIIGLSSNMPRNARRFVEERGVPIVLVLNFLEIAQKGELVFNLGTPVENIQKLR